ncbi:hypothetical protein [Bacteroidetes bacterium endosymbiont of Geopemphigus sp.]|uniref:hypothetical protein n=1 Tax=Bacteroidetes bacterium endosymbiont of Geopemphigus sp. TaxID=2047937 RepID=UPI0018A87D18|nr:hypothetical protein [Bacteroidetes bacterium endosymbiont of Geopemphigus sp.]
MLLNADAQMGNEAVVEKSNIFYPMETWIQKIRKNKKDYFSGKVSFDYELTDKISMITTSRYEIHSTPPNRYEINATPVNSLYNICKDLKVEAFQAPGCVEEYFVVPQ